MGDMRLHTQFVGKPEEKRPLGRIVHKGEVNMISCLKEILYDPRNWIRLAQNGD
jgi:hypothetical protein